MRPRTLDEIVGQEEALGAGKPLRRAIEARRAALADPVGAARLGQDDARPRHPPAAPRAHFEALSAVLSGVKELREVLRGGRGAPRSATAGAPSLFIDEIHRYNKAQQDALLAHVESGDVVLIGATTENPSLRGQRRAPLALPAWWC